MKKQSKKATPYEETAVAIYKEKTAALKGWGKWSSVEAIEDENHYLQAVSAIAAVKTIFAEAELQRKEITNPLNAVIKTVNMKVKPLTMACEELERHIKSLILLYDAEKRAKLLKAAEVQAKKAEKAGAEELAADIRSVATTKQVLPDSPIALKDNWKAEIKDPEALLRWALEDWKARGNLVCIDVAPLTALAKSQTRESEIPGVRFYNDQYVAYTNRGV